MEPTDRIVCMFLMVMCAAIAMINFHLHGIFINKRTRYIEKRSSIFDTISFVAYEFNWSTTGTLILNSIAHAIWYYLDVNIGVRTMSEFALGLLILNVILTWVMYTVGIVIENAIKLRNYARKYF